MAFLTREEVVEQQAMYDFISDAGWEAFKSIVLIERAFGVTP